MEQVDKKLSFGYLPDPKDSRDYMFKSSVAAQLSATSIDLTQGELFLPIRNQGKLGACTAFATGALVEFVRAKKNLIAWETSPLFTYYTTRQQTDNINEDSGASVRTVLKSVAKYGVAREEMWPYDISQFTVTPPSSAYEYAEKNQALVYYRIQNNKEDLLSCLLEGYPFVFGIDLYESFMQTQTDFLVYEKVPMFQPTKEKRVGGHCMVAVGFFTEGEQVYIKARNSWGPYVGLGGYHNIPIEYMLNQLGADFWTIRDLEFLEEEKFVPKPKPTPIPQVEVVKPLPLEPVPEIKPDPILAPEEPKQSIWKNPETYFIIVFAILCLVFFFW